MKKKISHYCYCVQRERVRETISEVTFLFFLLLFFCRFAIKYHIIGYSMFRKNPDISTDTKIDWKSSSNKKKQSKYRHIGRHSHAWLLLFLYFLEFRHNFFVKNRSRIIIIGFYSRLHNASQLFPSFAETNAMINKRRWKYVLAPHSLFPLFPQVQQICERNIIIPTRKFDKNTCIFVHERTNIFNKHMNH